MIKDGFPPDCTIAVDRQRFCNLPDEEIVASIQRHFPATTVTPIQRPDWDIGRMNFLCGYMTYHVAWYQWYSNNPTWQPTGYKVSTPCQRAGFTHVGGKVTVATGTTCVEIQLEEVIRVLRH